MGFQWKPNKFWVQRKFTYYTPFVIHTMLNKPWTRHCSDSNPCNNFDTKLVPHNILCTAQRLSQSWWSRVENNRCTLSARLTCCAWPELKINTKCFREWFSFDIFMERTTWPTRYLNIELSRKYKKRKNRKGYSLTIGYKYSDHNFRLASQMSRMFENSLCWSISFSRFSDWIPSKHERKS